MKRPLPLQKGSCPLLPKGLTKFHFNDNGSSSVEAALKIAFQYQLQTGHGERTRFMCLSDGYHGETIGALSVGSMDQFARLYQPMMMDNIHVKAPDCYRCPFHKTRENCQGDCIQYAEETFAQSAKETCALIVEPLLQGCAGMRVYPAVYLKNCGRCAMPIMCFLSVMKLPRDLAGRENYLPVTMQESRRIS